MKLDIGDKLTVLLSTAQAKEDLMTDICRSLRQDFSIPDIAKDFQNFGTPLEKLAGKRMGIATQQAKATYTAFEGIISPIALQALRTSEETGDVADAYQASALAIQSSEGLLSSLIRAYIVPIIKVLGLLFIISIIANEVFSQLATMVPRAKWSGISSSFYDLATFVYHKWSVILTLFIAFIVLVGLLITQVVGSPRSYLDKCPFFKDYRALVAISVLVQLGTLINAGKPFKESIDWVKQQQNRYGKWHLSKMAKNLNEVKRAGNIGHTLQTGLISDREADRLKRPIPENLIGDRLEQSGENQRTLLKRKVDKMNRGSETLVLFTSYGIMIWFFAAVTFLILSIQ